ncbi:MAG: winged helix-turn-helix transcriptional regulator [Thermoprotei archaeon]
MKTNVYELAARIVYPALRRSIVEYLWSLGLSNREIARLLGITPSAVTRYIRRERGVLIDFTGLPWIKERIARLANKILSGEVTVLEVEEELTRLAARILASKTICKYHLKIDPSIDPAKCNVCPRVFGSIT